MKKLLSFSLLLFTLVVTACSGQVNGNDYQKNNQEVSQDERNPIIPGRRLVDVEKVETAVLESFPVQVNLIVSGDFRNGCERFGRIRQIKRQNNIQVTIYSREVGEICTQALVPYRETVNLVFKNLKSGKYRVTVNGVKANFTI